MSGLPVGNLPDACRHAATAADLLHRSPDATGTARLRTFCAAAVRPLGPRGLDEHLAYLTA